jgi:hypothetical protein
VQQGLARFAVAGSPGRIVWGPGSPAGPDARDREETTTTRSGGGEWPKRWRPPHPRRAIDHADRIARGEKVDARDHFVLDIIFFSTIIYMQYE